MKCSLALLMLLLGLLLLSNAEAYACSSSCCSLSETISATSFGEAVGAGVDAVKWGVKYTAHTTTYVIHETPEQIAAIPDAIHNQMNGARDSANSLLDRSRNLLASAGQAVVNFSASLLRILFSSFLARA